RPIARRREVRRAARVSSSAQPRAGRETAEHGQGTGRGLRRISFDGTNPHCRTVIFEGRRGKHDLLRFVSIPSRLAGYNRAMIRLNISEVKAYLSKYLTTLRNGYATLL